jgi:hypothetical protein
MRYSLRTLLLLLAIAPLVLAAAWWWGGPRGLSRADRLAIAQAILTHVLTDPGMAGSRDFYGTPGDTQVALLDDPEGYSIAWPKGLPAKIAGYQVVHSSGSASASPNQPRLLGVALTRLDLPKPKTENKVWTGMFDSPVEITVTNASGSSNGGVIGGCIVGYSLKLENGKWIVKQAWSMDP